MFKELFIHTDPFNCHCIWFTVDLDRRNCRCTYTETHVNIVIYTYQSSLYLRLVKNNSNTIYHFPVFFHNILRYTTCSNRKNTFRFIHMMGDYSLQFHTYVCEFQCCFCVVMQIKLTNDQNTIIDYSWLLCQCYTRYFSRHSIEKY